MKLTLTGYRLRDKKRKDQRTIVAIPSLTSEVKFREQLRDGTATGTPVKGKLTPLYARTS